MSIKKKLKDKDCIGKWVYFHHKNNKKHKYRGIIIDEVTQISNDYAHRLQKMIFCQEKKPKTKEWVNYRKTKIWDSVRACYYVIGAKRNNIVFGQFCMNSSPRIVGSLFKKADRKGFFKKMSIKQMKNSLKRFGVYI